MLSGELVKDPEELKGFLKMELPIVKVITSKWHICFELSPLYIWGPFSWEGTVLVDSALWAVQAQI